MSVQGTGLHRSGRPPQGFRALTVALLTAVLAALLPLAGAAPARAAECPCSVWSTTDTPTVVDSGDGQAVELGLRFSSDVDGYVSGLRFYKSAANTGTHVGSLWTTDGVLLARTTFADETAEGWQSASFPAPVPVTAGTSYVISYHTPTGRYSVDPGYFGVPRDVAPLRVPATSATTPNGLFEYSAVPTFPTGTFNGNNYWVDPVFDTATPTVGLPTVPATTPADGATAVPASTPITATFSLPVRPGTAQITVTRAGGGTVPGTTAYDVAGRVARFQPSAALPAGETVTATLSGALDLYGRPLAAPVSWSFQVEGAVCPCTLWPDTVVPGVVDSGDRDAVELGLRFTSDADGAVSGVRFYKSAANTGTHVGSLWTTDGTLLARVTFADETATGWQTASFSAPVPVTAGTPYVISYHAPNGGYSIDLGYFANGYDAPPLRAPGGPASPNGLFTYSPVPAFPVGSLNSANYWVSPVLTTQPAAPVLTSVVVSPSPVSVVAGGTVQLVATGSFSDGSSAPLSEGVSWSASGAATVSGSGVVTGVSAGSATVTASVGEVSGSASVTVTAPVLTSVVVSPSPVSVVAGGTVQLVATGSFSDGSSAPLSEGVSWSASGAATVSVSGVVTGVSAGSATVTASVGEVSGSASVTVTAPVLTSITVTPGASKPIVGITQQLTATGTFSDGSTRVLTTGVTWTSTSTGVATVSSTGLLTPRAAGTTTIRATVGSVSGSTTATVRSVRSVRVTPSLTLSIFGGPQQLTATASLSDGTTVDVTRSATWSSSVSWVASVSSTGLVTPRFLGITTIRAKVGSVTGYGTVIII